MADTLRERIEAGAARLDEHFGEPTWRDRINPPELDISHGRHCILGQLFRDESGEYGWDAGKNRLGINVVGAHSLGFAADYDTDPEIFEHEEVALTTEWRRYLGGEVA